MGIGPIQLLYFKFDSTEKLTGQIRKELTDLRGKGLIHLIDVLAVSKSADGTVSRESASDLSDTGAQRFGSAIKKALGLEDPDAMSNEEAMDLVGQSLGLSATDLSKLEAEIEPGEAGLVMLFEHAWAKPLREAVMNAGGKTVMQAFLSPDAVAMVGGEVNAVLKAQAAIEAADKVRAAAMLDAMVSMAGADRIAQLSAAKAAEAETAAALIEASAMEDAEQTIAAAELVKQAAMADTFDTVISAEAVKEEAEDEAAEAILLAAAIEDAAAEDVAETLEADELIKAAAAQDVEDTLAAADAIKAAAVAETLRVLIESGEIQDAAVADTMNTLAAAGVIKQAALNEANAAAADL